MSVFFDFLLSSTIFLGGLLSGYYFFEFVFDFKERKLRRLYYEKLMNTRYSIHLAFRRVGKM